MDEQSSPLSRGRGRPKGSKGKKGPSEPGNENGETPAPAKAPPISRGGGRPKKSKEKPLQPSEPEKENEETSTTAKSPPLPRRRGRPLGSKGKPWQPSESENNNEESSITASENTRKKKKKGTYKQQWTNHAEPGKEEYAKTLEELVASGNLPSLGPLDGSPAGAPGSGSTSLSAGGPGLFSQGQIPVYTREDWKAIDPTGELSPMKPLVNNVRFVDTGKGSERCKGQESCFNVVQRIQQQHMSQGLGDINYNFLVADDGSVYIGRGFEADCVRSEDLQHLKGDCYDIAFIGDYRTEEVPGPTLAAGYNMIAYGHDKKNIKSHPKIIKTMDLKDRGFLDVALKKYFDECYTLK